MRLFGHPVHVMLVHFPVALWPAHAALHLLGRHLPEGAAGTVGFWLLAGGTALGWLAAGCGLSDLLTLQRDGEGEKLSAALTHGLINGGVLTGFTCLLAVEYPHYPAIAHGPGFLTLEITLLILLGVGNYFGGNVVWKNQAAKK